ncbi:MAG TPA: SagB/ThcOx family dehydrogenase [Geomobilimonas sp.]|nr:SagB/ThcOx family dehydrogenase [Geomobilimonas sp.]
MITADFESHRAFLKDTLRLKIDFRQTDQSRGVAPPPLAKPPRPDQQLIPLPSGEAFSPFAARSVVDAIAGRQSHRHFRDDPLELTELAFLLWATQGVREVLDAGHALRTVPSAGCRHPFESYLLVSRVAGLAPALYRYLPVEHALVLERPVEEMPAQLARATLGQRFVAAAPVTFAWTALPYRTEWRYGLAAHRVILMDAGHLCQNLYLACAAIDAGTCAIAAYHQELMDQLLGVDGNDEFTVYLAPVGKLRPA